MKFCAFDVEGRTDDTGVTSIAIYSDIVQYVERDVSIGIEVLRQHANKGYTLVAHNAEYDISVLFWQYGIHVRCIYYNDRFNRGEWVYTSSRKVVQIWDSLSLSGGLPLKDVGESLNLPKYPTPQRLLGIEPNQYKWQCIQHNIWECEECYVLRDAEIVYRFMESYQDFMLEYGAKPQRTIGSAAVALWRAISMPNKIYLRKEEYDTFARQSYYGGRCECFKVGAIHGLYTADVKSMYPSVMRDTPLPNPETTNHLDNRKNDMSVIQFEGCSDCTVYIPRMYVPPLPVKVGNKLQFPVGLVRNVWTHNELRYALTLGCEVQQIHSSLYSRDSVYPFVEYVDTLFSLRSKYKASGDPRQLTVKILLNSLYGRMGLSKVQEQITIERILPGQDFRDIRGKMPIWVGNNIFVEDTRSIKASPPYANVLWASIITAEARIRLHKYLALQGESIAYCDTDSVYSLNRIVGLDEGLGKLCEEEYWNDAIIISPKIYRLTKLDGTTISKAKGVPKRVADDFIDSGYCEYESAMRPRQALHRNIQAGTWVVVHKTMRTVPSKRIVLSPDVVRTKMAYSDTIAPTFEIDMDDESY